MQLGFIKLHRSILDWEWYDDPNTMRLFLHCLLRANHKDNNWRGILIKRGSFLTSLETLSKETKLSVSQIRTSLNKLKKTNEIASLSQARNRMISIVEYEQYQGSDKVDDKIVASSSQDSDKVVTTNKNDKKVKNDKNEENNNGEFELVWSMYEKKGNKKTSQNKFNNMTDTNKQLMAKHLPEYVKSTPNKQYRKNLETYINQECWNDELSDKGEVSQYSAITQKNIRNLQGEW